jgi:catechol 2,3-dioxygenase-like lactoylglutathione lyase family enzyme
VVFACAALCGGAALLSAWGARLPTDGKLGLLTGWLGPQGGSSFPLLPFSGYVFAGVVIGALALPEGGRTLASRTRSRLLLTAAGLCALALAASVVPFSIVGTVPKFAHSPSFFLQKLAAVSVALWLLTLALSRVTALPRALRVLTGETLGVYVFHLFVLYGFPIGLAKRFGPTLPLTAALSVSAGMLVASVLAGLAWRAIKDLPHTQRFVPSSRAVVFAACLVLGAGGLLFASRSLAEPSANHTSAVRSVSLTVADLEASRDFFVQALGFQAEGAPRQLSGPEFAGLLGVPAAQARSQKLRLGAEMIELVAFAQPAGRPTPADSRSDDLWFQHLALVTSDIDAVHARLAKFKAAAAISAGVQTIPRDNPAAAGIRAFYFRGPAAHPLELIWFPTGKGEPRWQSKAAPLLGIDHTAIAVADSERSRGFYENLLGLHVAGHSFNHGSEQVALSAVPGAQVQITGLRGPQGPGVEFLEYKAPLGGRRTPDDARPSDLWHWEISIAVADLDRTVVQLRAAHAHFISDAIHDTHLFADTARAVLVADPDGHAVRLVQ